RGPRRSGGLARDRRSAAGDRAPSRRCEDGAAADGDGSDGPARRRNPEARDDGRGSASDPRRFRPAPPAGIPMSSFTRPYARAFVEAAPKGYDFTKFLESGEAMARSFQDNSTLRGFLLAPNVPREAKKKAIDEIASKVGMDAYGTRFLQVMLRNHRLLE